MELALLPATLPNGIGLRAPLRIDVDAMLALLRSLSGGANPVVSVRAAHQRSPDAYWESLAASIPSDELRVVVIVDATTEIFLGFAGLLSRAAGVGGPEFYCFLAESARGRGVGETVGRWLLAATFGIEQAAAVCAVIKPTNLRALKLANRLGFREATEVEAARIAVQDDQAHDCKLVLTSADYQLRQNAGTPSF
jgi:RimJ/RimL family protein N-acetyltransferase